MSDDAKYIVAYVWILSIVGSLYFGHELAMTKYDRLMRKCEKYFFNPGHNK